MFSITIKTANVDFVSNLVVAVVPKGHFEAGKERILVARVLYSSGGQYCLCCISQELARLIESAAILAGASSILWSWPKNGDDYTNRWEKRIPHEFVDGEIDPLVECLVNSILKEVVE